MPHISESMTVNPFACEGISAEIGQPVASLCSTWYVVETRPRQERFAIENLHLQKFTTFWPRFWKTSKHARQQKTVLAPLFPGYLFVALAAIIQPVDRPGVVFQILAGGGRIGSSPGMI